MCLESDKTGQKKLSVWLSSKEMVQLSNRLTETVRIERGCLPLQLWYNIAEHVANSTL